MQKIPTRTERKSLSVAQVVNDLLRFWLPSFKKMDWTERLGLLEQIDIQLGRDFAEGAAYRRISHLFTAEILRKIPVGTIQSREQAYFMLNSADDGHREAARVWFILNRIRVDEQESRESVTSFGTVEHRATPRHTVKLPGILALGEASRHARLVDISVGGARLEITEAMPAGSRVVLELPMLGRVAALVVWAATGVAGLSFSTEQASLAM